MTEPVPVSPPTLASLSSDTKLPHHRHNWLQRENIDKRIQTADNGRSGNPYFLWIRDWILYYCCRGFRMIRYVFDKYHFDSLTQLYYFRLYRKCPTSILVSLQIKWHQRPSLCSHPSASLASHEIIRSRKDLSRNHIKISQNISSVKPKFSKFAIKTPIDVNE